MDPDLDPERGLKLIRIRPNAVDPDPQRCLMEYYIAFVVIVKTQYVYDFLYK